MEKRAPSNVWKMNAEEAWEEGFKAGAEKHEHDEHMCQECLDMWIEAQKQARQDFAEEVMFQVEKLNTLELKEKAPLCWTKLQQFIEFIEALVKKKGG